jgi:hypothetical protein
MGWHQKQQDLKDVRRIKMDDSKFINLKKDRGSTGSVMMIGGNNDITVYDNNSACKTNGFVHVVGVLSADDTLQISGISQVLVDGPCKKGQALYAHFGGFTKNNQLGEVKRKTLVGIALTEKTSDGVELVDCLLKL